MLASTRNIYQQEWEQMERRTRDKGETGRQELSKDLQSKGSWDRAQPGKEPPCVWGYSVAKREGE